MQSNRGISRRSINICQIDLLVVVICLIFLVQFTHADSPKTDQPTADFVPQWAKKVVWYQIFPERFRNGDASNDPTLEDIQGAYPDDNKSLWKIHPWTSDWYKMQPWEAGSKAEMGAKIQRRRYGGDIQGIIDRLDYLQALGITALYLNPVFDAPSMHKYDGASYHHIDPTLGPDPAGDRKKMAGEIPHDPKTWVWTEADLLVLELIKQAHSRNMRIIFDGVFNHMGVNSWAFQDVKEKQQDSLYKDWFTVLSWDDPVKGTTFDYEGWYGYKTLPELREDKNGIVAGPRQYIFDSTARWMKPVVNGVATDGIDGWRLDVAFCINHKFWKDWRKVVKSLNPEAYITAEVIDPIKVLLPYLQGDEFDAVMNYNFAFSSAEFFIDTEPKTTVSKFDQNLRELREAFHPAVAYVQQNLFDSHDTNRLGSHIRNSGIASYRDWGAYFGKSKADNPQYDVRKPSAEHIQIQKLMAVMQMTYVGAPMIYYGDEVGMWGANDPDCRKPMVWDDLQYEDEIVLADGSARAVPDKVEVNKDLLEHYRKLIKIRNNHPALQTGDFKTELIDDKKDIYAFSRNSCDQRILVILNNGSKARRVKLPKNWRSTKRIDLLNGKTSSRSRVKISAKSAAILLAQ